MMEQESHDVLERHAKKERIAAYKAGLLISALFLIPILITFLVFVSSGMGLGVFSVVASSMLLIAALTARYLPANRWIKGGIILMISGIWIAFSTDVYTLIAEQRRQLMILSADFTDWSTEVTTNTNVYLILLILGVVLDTLAVGIGIWHHKRGCRKIIKLDD